MTITRRDFLIETAAVTAGLATAAVAETSENRPGEMPMRVLGRTRERVSLLGFGMAPLGSDNTTPDEAERVVKAALDMGINYVDVAPVYGSDNSKYGNAETKLKGVLTTRRHGIFLVTKVNAGRQDKAGVLTQLEESLKRMGTDHIDLVHIHNLGDFDMERVFGPDGALAGLLEAKKRGLLRYIGTSGHMRPARFVKAFETGHIDVTMNALNFADRHTYDFEGLVLPAAKKHGTAIVAMKVLGGATNWQYDGKTAGTLAEYHARAIRYSLGLPGVCCAVVGFANEKEARLAVEVARNFQPLTAEERESLLGEGRRLASARGLYYGAVEG